LVNIVVETEILLSVDSDLAGIETQKASQLFRGLPAVQNGEYDVTILTQCRALADGPSPLKIPEVMPQFVDSGKVLDEADSDVTASRFRPGLKVQG
jgi:hypothetical protein